MDKPDLPRAIRAGLWKIAHLSDDHLITRHERMQELYAAAIAGGTFSMDGADAIIELGNMLFGTPQTGVRIVTSPLPGAP